MFSSADTIVAIATPPGRGGIGVVRLSGPTAGDIAARMVRRPQGFPPREATFCRFSASRDELQQPVPGDHVVVTFFQSPSSYTGDDVVEVSAHGSPVVLQALLREAMALGARLAEPGEFTLRAFLNGKLDLIQAEAVADLVNAVTPLQARSAYDQLEGTLTTAIAAIEEQLFNLIAKLEASLDFPEEGYHFLAPSEAGTALARVIASVETLCAQGGTGRLVREGAHVVIVGAPNVGKSSVFNALVRAERAIVTPIAGTTRDLVTERVDVGGVLLTLVDTAGMRPSVDIVEAEGVARSRGSMRMADLVLVVLDGSRSIGAEDRDVLREASGLRRVLLRNKADLQWTWEWDELAVGTEGQFDVSALTGLGVDRLAVGITEALVGGEILHDCPAVTNIRQLALLERSLTALQHAASAIGDAKPEEFALLDLHEAAQALQEITGRRTSEDLLKRIFERFCIGK